MENKSASKTVPESVVIGLRKDLREAKRKLADAETELRNARLDLGDDESVSVVRKHLLEEARALEDKRSKHEEDLTTFSEREREVTAKELALNLKNKGVEVTPTVLLEAEDMSTKANDLYAAFLEEKAKEKKEAGGKEGPSQESKESPESEAEEKTKVYESATPMLTKKQPKDMNDTEFNEYWEHLKQESLSKK